LNLSPRSLRNAILTIAICATCSASESKAASAHGHFSFGGSDIESRSILTQPGGARKRFLALHHERLQSGIASIYSGGRTANGERVHAGTLTAAHRNLPFGTMVRVINDHTGQSVVVRINDRGPFVRGRVIDLSPAAARTIGVRGIAQVSLRTN
jgi:rare lipoprotein A